MVPAQVTIRDIITIFKRRILLFFIPVVLLTLMSIGGSYLLPKLYEVNTVILYQRNDVATPLLGLEFTSNMGAEDRIRMYREILLSRSVLDKLIDSLGWRKDIKSEQQLQVIFTSIAKRIEIANRSSNTFVIGFSDRDPYVAQQTVKILTSLLIETVSKVQTQQNENAVAFFEGKLKEIKEKLDENQRKLMAVIGNRVSSLPEQGRTQYLQIENIDRQINQIENQIAIYQQSLQTLQKVTQHLNISKDKEELYNLARNDIPFAQDLNALLKKYDEMLLRYTSEYPEVKKIENQIIPLLQRIKNSIDSDLIKKQSLKNEQEKIRQQLIDNMRDSYVSLRLNGEQESDYNLYKKLYEDMKVKLEQARTTRDLGYTTANQFVILDPPILPTKPTKPKKTQIVIAGFGLGIFLGLLFVIIRELLDTTIRTPRDIEIFQKPIIAYLTDGKEEK